MTKLLKTTAVSLALAAGAVALPQVAAAQSASVLTVDMDQIQQNSAAAKSAVSQLQAKYQARLTAARTSYQNAVNAYNAAATAAKKVQKPDGSLPAANQTQVEQAQNALETARQNAGNLQTEVNSVEQYVNYQIIQHVQPVTEQIRQQRKAALVVPQGSALAFDPAGDITTQVIQQLDRSFPTPSVTLPPQNGQAPAAAPATTQPQGR